MGGDHHRRPSSATIAPGGTVPRLDSQLLSSQLELKNRALASSAEGITIADATLPGNPLIYVNAGFERLTGYTVEEVTGRNCNFLQGSETDPATADQLRNAVRNKLAITVTILNYCKDGTPFWNRLSITPVLDTTGTVSHFIGVQSDVSVEKQAKDELQRVNERLEAVSRVLRRDLEAAADVQRSLLPAAMPNVPGVRFAYKFRPCADVGGDCLNVLSLDSQHLGFYILDVSGHGVASALLSVTLSHMLSVEPERSFLYQSSPSDAATVRQYSVAPPCDVVTRLNRHFANRPAISQFFTMIYAILDQKTAELRYVSAGHLSPIHFRSGSLQPIPEAGGIPVGLLPNATYEESSLQFLKGDRLYLCTDGILEAENEAGEEFGVDRVLETLLRDQTMSLEESLKSLMQRVEAWSAPNGPTDDASVLGIEHPL